ncbi:MAG TPA: hypothetical protein VKA55_06800 [Gammaproteobacteria bacterium]|nr:hypothetical protein [Gammaproteobacteria bacterium]
MATLNELDNLLRDTLHRLNEMESGDSETSERYLRKARASIQSLRTSLALEALTQLNPSGPRDNPDKP